MSLHHNSRRQPFLLPRDDAFADVEVLLQPPPLQLLIDCFVAIISSIHILLIISHSHHSKPSYIVSKTLLPFLHNPRYVEQFPPESSVVDHDRLGMTDNKLLLQIYASGVYHVSDLVDLLESVETSMLTTQN